jgi:hypothetical protein
MKLIPLDAVLAEIEKLQLCTMDEHMNYYSAEAQGEYNALSKLESFIDTFEVKEVDIEKEVIDWWNAHYSSKAYTFEGYTGHYVENSTLIEIAKHFFKLGLNASNPLTWEDVNSINHLLFDIKEDYDNGRLDKEEYYTEVLKRFKDLKK